MVNVNAFRKGQVLVQLLNSGFIGNSVKKLLISEKVHVVHAEILGIQNRYQALG